MLVPEILTYVEYAAVSVTGKPKNPLIYPNLVF